jgi:regulator of sirC expression with transglutaminase-like and TPR domain
MTLALTALAAAPLEAAEAVDHRHEYDACIALSERAPAEALEAADAWSKRNGGAAAEHCAALALLRMGRTIDAAERLEALATVVPFDGNPSAMDVMAQASQAWLMAGDQARALHAINAALQGAPDDPELLLDRAQILGDVGDYDGALNDLDKVTAMLPENADAATFRASALRHLDLLPDAMTEINRAMMLDPENPSARLERGIIHYLNGDNAAALNDLRGVVDAFPGTPSADVANGLLQHFRIRQD